MLSCMTYTVNLKLHPDFAVGQAVHRQKEANAAVSELRRRIAVATEVGEDAAKKRGCHLKVSFWTFLLDSWHFCLSQ